MQETSIALGGRYTVEFEVPLEGVPMDSLIFLAGALSVGFRLLSGVNHEDLLLGPATLGRFKGAERAKLRRVIRWHFAGTPVLIEGRATTANDFREMWRDATFSADVMLRPGYDALLLALRDKYEGRRRMVACALDGSRASYGLLGGDPAKLVAMARFHDNGW